MCNVCKMIAAKSPLPLQEPYNMVWQKITKVIDLLHLRNHRDPKCKKDFSPAVLKEKFPRLNTPVAEQTFVWAARFKKILCAMPQKHFLFFYLRMVVKGATGIRQSVTVKTASLFFLKFILPTLHNNTA